MPVFHFAHDLHRIKWFNPLLYKTEFNSRRCLLSFQSEVYDNFAEHSGTFWWWIIPCISHSTNPRWIRGPCSDWGWHKQCILAKKYLGFISLLRILPIKWGKLFSLFNDRHSKFFKMKWPSFVFLSLFLLSDIISLSHSSSFPWFTFYGVLLFWIARYCTCFISYILNLMPLGGFLSPYIFPFASS